LEINHLRNKVGNEVNWFNHGLNKDETYEVLTELEVGGTPYAVVHPRGTEEGPFIFKYSFPADGTHQLSPIDDDDEWEQAAEAFDHWLYEFHRNS
jgi:uncharacterized protein YrzB (UPF0473 family)